MKRFSLFPILILLFGSSLFLGGCTRSAAENENGGIFPTPFAPSPDPQKIYTPENAGSTVQTIDSAITLLETGFMGEDLLILSLEIPAEMGEDFYAKVQDEEYECTRQQEIPDRLYCFGQIPQTRQNLTFFLFSLDHKELIWQTGFDYPDMDNN